MPIYIDKLKGQTPLELVKSFKKEHNIKDKVCYAGRLDPMARGKMILLKGIECKEMIKYCNLRKKYKFTVLFGFETDTYDLLGLVMNKKFNFGFSNSIDTKKYIGKFKQKYPAYSSFIVRHNEVRRPIWEWTKMGKLSEIEIPSKDIEIYDFTEEENEIYIPDYEILRDYIFDNINLLSPENKKKFRVSEIMDKWNETFGKIDLSIIPIIKTYIADVSSGTYIRSLVDRIGKDLGTNAITLDIARIYIEI
tara:strand:- start:562 stop:1311 length:750 start_codon:yes stop_codon:yes gene_type:complete